MFAKGAALYLFDCPPELTREEVKSKIEELGIAVAYMYFSKGDKEGWVRLQEADSAAEVCFKYCNSTRINNNILLKS